MLLYIHRATLYTSTLCAVDSSRTCANIRLDVTVNGLWEFLTFPASEQGRTAALHDGWPEYERRPNRLQHVVHCTLVRKQNVVVAESCRVGPTSSLAVAPETRSLLSRLFSRPIYYVKSYSSHNTTGTRKQNEEHEDCCTIMSHAAAAAAAASTGNGSDQDDEEDILCPVCLTEFPALTWRGTGRNRFLCCGKAVCDNCHSKICEQGGDKAGCPFCQSAVAVSDRERVRRVRAHADSGKPWALTMLGDFHKNGIGKRRNPAFTVECYRKAAEMGYTTGQQHLGECYLFGIGTERDVDDAARSNVGK
jgi:hypothetical protein